VNRLVTKQRHAEYQSKHLISGQATPANGGLTGKIQRRRYPFNGNILGKGAQVAEVEKVAEVDQVLLNRHKKSDARGLASDFRISPALTQMLK